MLAVPVDDERLHLFGLFCGVPHAFFLFFGGGGDAFVGPKKRGVSRERVQRLSQRQNNIRYCLYMGFGGMEFWWI